MKKGAVELTLNTIVIIIFAITLLGLGLFFIRQYFGEATKLIPFPEPKVEATADDPIVLGFENMEVQRNSQAQFKVGFYNNYNESVSVKPEISECVPEGLGNSTQSITETVEVGKTVTFETIFTIPKNAQSQIYSCKLVVGQLSKQFSVQVQ
ncbi:MAG: hypothetical protein V1702_02290 [Candidatus Woesearchaeota archaeon]